MTHPHRHVSEDGSALVELALVLPVLILMLLGSIDMALILQWDMAIAASLEAGAEYATLSTSTLSGVQAVATTAASGVPGYSVIAVDTCLCGSASGSAACSSGSCSSGTPTNYVTITATATLPLLFGVKGLPVQYAVSATQRIRQTGGA